MKSKTESGEPVRAQPLVGSTWLGPSDEVAERHRRVLTEQDLAGVLDAAEVAEGLVRQDLEMLGRIVVDEGDRLVLVAGEHDAADRAGEHG